MKTPIKHDPDKVLHLQSSRFASKIHPQYNDGSNLSRELFAVVNLIDAIVDYQQSIVMPPDYQPACLQKALQWANSRSSDIMNRMDTEPAQLPSA